MLSQMWVQALLPFRTTKLPPNTFPAVLMPGLHHRKMLVSHVLANKRMQQNFGTVKRGS
jgi:hypothetical protein